MIPIESTIGVCLATYRRPEGLAAALAGVAAQVLDEALPARLLVVVVDNDPGASAEAVVDEARRRHGIEIHYSVEPRRGVVHARNAAVAAALDADADFVAFLDDDESPHPDWLLHLMATQSETGAPIVGGPVVEQLGGHIPTWYRRAKFYEPPRHHEGARAPYAACGNALYSGALLATVEGPFDERFNVSGGEDVFLSLMLAKQGAAIVWSPAALVDTSVPAERARLRHVARRHYIGAANFTRAERILHGRNYARIATGAGRMFAGSGRAVIGAARLAPHRIAIGIVDAAEGLGVLSGALGGGARSVWWSSRD